MKYNFEYTEKIIELIKVNSTAARILFFLVDRADKGNTVNNCSYLFISDVLDLSIPTIARAIKTLKEMGFIIVHKSETSNIYEINEEIYNSFRK